MSEDNITNRTFEVEGVKYSVIQPNLEQLTEANAMRAKAFNEALQRGDLLRDQLDTELRKRHLWNDDREEIYQGLRQSIIDGEYSLSKGGIKLDEAKDIALKMSESRQKMVEMLSSRSDLDSNTCEGKADAVRFNYLFSQCLVYEDTGEPVYSQGLADYLLKQDSPEAIKGATEFYYLISGAENLDRSLPENKFLKSYEFVDESYRLIDKDGRLVDDQGRHIDEQGNFINWLNDDEFEVVDSKGRKVSEATGKFEVEFSPFLDDTGKPVEVKKAPSFVEEEAEAEAEAEPEEEAVEETEEKSAPKKRRGRPKKVQPEKNKEETSEEESS